jgi:uncharacterized protein
LTARASSRQDAGVNELIHAVLPFALRPAGGKACAFSVDEAGTLTLSGEARSDLFIDPSGEGERPEAGYLLGVPPRGDFTLAARITVPFASLPGTMLSSARGAVSV